MPHHRIEVAGQRFSQALPVASALGVRGPGEISNREKANEGKGSHGIDFDSALNVPLRQGRSARRAESLKRGRTCPKAERTREVVESRGPNFSIAKTGIDSRITNRDSRSWRSLDSPNSSFRL